MAFIRLAEPNDIPRITEIEISASQKFLTLENAPLCANCTVPTEQLETACSQNLLWVIEDEAEPAGFLCAFEIDCCLHIEELSVSMDHQGKGLGKELLNHVMNFARVRRYSAITLTTDKDIPWNGPFYQRMGFRILAEQEKLPKVYAVLEEDHSKYHDPETRVAMIYKLEELVH